ncbi:hypothetical protein [Xenorhabdus mauleonii]|uniref:hypothetical protein n=1 Tax=Xenorhabdus mauleonii TaxID=351675 RepID=UPI000AECFBAB|nr:hypothetical protein [Xenorhabdus mauleonii]
MPLAGSLPPTPAERLGRCSPVAERETYHKIRLFSPSSGTMATILLFGLQRQPCIKAQGKNSSKVRIDVVEWRAWVKQVKRIFNKLIVKGKIT